MYMDERLLNELYRHNFAVKGTRIVDPDTKKKDSKDSKESKLTKKYRKKIAGKILTLSQLDNEYWLLVLELIKTASQYNQQEKNSFVTDILASYKVDSGGLPVPNAMLEALADYLLDSSHSDKDVDKVTNTEYPVLSPRQLGKRGKKEIGVDTLTLELLSNTMKRPKNKRTTTERPENK